MTKYRAVPTVVDGIRFDSKAEARRYGTLRALERAGKIAELRLQPAFDCIVNGRKICTYRADFQYRGADGVVVEDVKGAQTQVYRLKKKLVEALHGVSIVEIPA